MTDLVGKRVRLKRTINDDLREGDIVTVDHKVPGSNNAWDVSVKRYVFGMLFEHEFEILPDEPKEQE